MARLAAIVLAAGASNRFGAENKLLAPIGGKPLVRGVAEAALAAGITDVVVVTGCEAARIEEALAGLSVRFVPNADWQTGMGSSIAAGARALGDGVDGAFIVPGDMPFLRPDMLRGLVSAFEQNERQAIVYPATPDGEQRNPVVWPRRFFAELTGLSGREGGKRLLQSRQSACVAVTMPDATAFADIDTREDLDAAVARSL
jgi:molybdenum cofactor cytidylyltransferase